MEFIDYDEFSKWWGNRSYAALHQLTNLCEIDLTQSYFNYRIYSSFEEMVESIEKLYPNSNFVVIYEKFKDEYDYTNYAVEFIIEISSFDRFRELMNKFYKLKMFW